MEETRIKIHDELPEEVQELYGVLYTKIEGIVAGDKVIDLRSDPTTLRILIESAMTVVEKFRNADGQGWSGPEKKRYALTLIKFVLQDLSDKGKIDKEVAKDLIANLDFWGGVAMDVAVDAIKKAFDIGQEFARDVQAEGCNAACKQNCCCVIC